MKEPSIQNISSEIDMIKKSVNFFKVVEAFHYRENLFLITLSTAHTKQLIHYENENVRRKFAIMLFT